MKALNHFSKWLSLLHLLINLHRLLKELKTWTNRKNAKLTRGKKNSMKQKIIQRLATKVIKEYAAFILQRFNR